MTHRSLGVLAFVIGLATAADAAAQTINVRTVEDRSHVTVMEFGGIYDRQPEANRAYEQAVREAVSKEFYRTHADDYDFLVTFTRFPYALGTDTDGAVGGRYYQIKNDIAGIGLDQFDFSAQFGSSGALQGYIDMGVLSRLATNPTDPRFEQTLSVLAHEMMHRWGARVRFRDADGSLGTALLGKDGAHWSALVNSYNSVLYGHEWRDNGDGTFTSIGRARTFYSPLDLYLMGILDRSQVPPFFVIDSPDLDPASVPELGLTITGVKRTVTIDDIIAAEGERMPAAADAPKRFKMGFVFLVRPGETADGIELAAINAVRDAFTTRALILTGGSAVVEVFPEAAADPIAPPTPILPPSSGPRTGPIDLVQGLDWLLARQRADGSWADSMPTRVRDSAAVFELLREVPSAFTAYQQGLAWLSGLQEHQNVDMVSRRLLAIRPQFSALDTAFLNGSRNASGGWGLGPGYRSDPFDSALALLAAPAPGAAAADIAYLLGSQNVDGGWSFRPGTASSVQATIMVLQLGERFAGNGALDAALARGLGWLQGRQNPDGGFGEQGSTTYDTAQAVLRLVNSSFPKPQIALALDYLRQGQRADGSWNESAFETALAIRALKTAQLPNALIAAGSVAVSTASPIDGEPVTVNAIVANESVSDIGALIVSLFDGDPAAGGVQIGTDLAIGALPALTQVPVSFVWDTTGRAGTHALFVVVDRLNQVDEFDEADNQGSAPVSVRPPPVDPELSVRQASLSFLPAALQSLPQSQTLSAIIDNAGQTAVSGVAVWLYEGDPDLGKKVAEAVVNVGGRSNATIAFTFSIATPAQATYIVVVDPQGQLAEADETNNRASRVLPVHSTHDFLISGGTVALSASPIPLGHDLAITAEILNRGTTDAFAVPVRIYIDDPAAGPIDVATLTLNLPAGGSAPASGVWRTSRPLDDVPVVVQVDPENAFPENAEDNNRVSAPLTVSASTEANLRVTHLDLSVTTPVLQGGNATISIPVRNNGFAAATNVAVDFYAGLPGQGGVQIGTRQTIASLPSGTQAMASVAWTDIPTFGDKLIFVVVDAAGTVPEFDEQDNTAFITADVLSLPDLAVSSASLSFAPPFPKQGDQLTISALVSNLGEQAGANVAVRFFTGAPGSGVPIGPEQTLQIAGKGHATASVTLEMTSSGAPAVLVQVDAANLITELDETNNVASRTVGVQDGSVYFTNRYFSPNGDDVMDRTEFFFRLSAGVGSAVQAVDAAGEVVRAFESGPLSSGSVEWDGRDEAGRIVPDGEYVFHVLGAGGAVLASAPVVVDNNNLSVGEAVGTRYLLNTSLSEGAQGPVSPVPFGPSYDHLAQGWLADDSGLLTIIPTQLYCGSTFSSFWVFCTNYQHLSSPEAGVYVTSPDGRTRTRITPDSWTKQSVVPAPPGVGAIGPARTGTWVVGAKPSPDGQKVLIALRTYWYYAVACGNCGGLPLYRFQWTTDGQPSTDANSGNELWVVNADGSGLARLGRITDHNQLRLPNMPSATWSPDLTKVAVHSARGQFFGSAEYFIDAYRADGSGSPVNLAHASAGSYLGNVDFVWTPDSNRLVYHRGSVNGSSNSWHSVKSDGTDRRDLIMPEGGTTVGATWLDNESFAGLVYDFTTNRQVVIRMSATGGASQRLTPEGMYVISAVGRPGGGGLAFTDWISAPFSETPPESQRSSTGIWIVDAEGRVQQIYTATPQNSGINSLHWSDDGGRLAFVERIITEFRVCAGEGWYFCGDEFFGAGVVDIQTGTVRVTGSPEIEAAGGIVGFFADANAFLVIRYDPDDKATLVAIGADDGRVTELIQAPQGSYVGQFWGVDSGFTPSGKYFLYWSPTYTAPAKLWSLSSLLNLTTDLSFQREQSQLVVRGTAEDRNFLSYTLEAASISSPDSWFPIAPPSETPVINDVLARWIPPSEDTFIVRLTATDKAGNQSMVRRRITWGLAPTITNVVVTPRVFSPNGDAVRDTAALDYVVLGPVNLQFTIYNAANLAVRSISQSHSTIGTASIAWDGRSDGGQVVADGIYRIHVLTYDFFVTVDTTPPDVRLSLGSAFLTVPEKKACVQAGTGIECSLFPGPVVETPVHNLIGRAVDTMLASWTLESGVGVNPAEWVGLDQGSDILAARDARSQPLVPVADTKMRSFTDARSVVSRRYRLSAVDQAGNQATIVSDFAPEEIIVHAWDGIPIPTNRTLEQALGAHRLSVVQTVRAPLQNLRVQTRLAGSTIWADQAAVSLPAAAFEFAWNNSTLAGGKTYEVRLAGRDVNGNDYLSNVFAIHSDLFEFTKAESSFATRTSVAFGLASLREELESLQLVMAVAGDPDIGLGQPQFTDPVTFTISVAPDPALDACTGAAVPARLKGVGLSGRVYYSNIRNVTRFGLSTRTCTSPANGAILELFVERIAAAGCNLPNPQKVRITITGHGVDTDTLKLLLQGVPDGLFDETAIDSLPFTMELDTSSRAEGTYLVKASGLTPADTDGSRITVVAGGSFVVDRTAPVAQITYPAAHTQVCPSLSGSEAIVAIEGVAQDANFERYEIEWGNGETPNLWTRLFPLSAAQEIQSRSPRQGILANWNVTQLPRGTYTLCLKVFDKGGNATCHRVTFELQGGVSLQQVKAGSRLISPNGDGNQDSAEVSFVLDAPALITARVYALVNGQRAATPTRTIVSNVQHLAGGNTLLWDGHTDLGVAASDGLYEIVLGAADACGIPRSESVLVEVDRSPPDADIAAPEPGNVSRVLIDVRGSVADAHFSGYTLDVGEGAAPADWTVIATGHAPITSGLLGQWNNRGEAGAYTLRLTATDAAGNQTEQRVAVNVTINAALISSVTGDPGIFSPNGDGKSDSVIVDYVTTAAAHVTVDVLSGESVVATVTPEYQAAPGAHAATWHGRLPSGQPFADGEYAIRVTATAAADPGRVQTEQFAVIVDTTPPALAIATPGEGAYVRGDIAVTGAIGDSHIDTYAVRYGTASSGPIVMLDEGAQVRTNHTFGALAGLADGSYVVEITAADLAQNSATLKRTFFIDGGSPTVALTSPQAGAIAGGDEPVVDVRGSVNEPNLQQWTLRFGAGLDPASWTTIATQTSQPATDALASWDTTPIADGPYTLSLIAVDRAGGTTEARTQILVDHTAPAAAIRQPADGARIGAPVVIRGDAMDANFASAAVELSPGPPSTAFEFVTLATLSQPVNDGVLFDLQSLPADGVYTLRLTVVDEAGQETTRQATVVIDTEPPVAPVGLVAALENGVSARLTWTASGDSALAGYHVYRGGQRVTPAPIAATTYLDAGLPDGTHRYTVRAVDAGGFESVPSNEAGVAVDLTPPVANIQSPAGGAIVSDLVDIRGTASSAADFASYRVLVADGASPLEAAFTVVRQSSAPVSGGSLAQVDTLGRPAGSAFTVRLIAEDLSGNRSTDQVTLTVDNQQPAAPALLSAVATGSTVTITWQGVADPDVVGYVLYNNSLVANARRIVTGSLTPYLLAGPSFSDAGLADGDYEYSVAAVDRAGNLSAPSNSLTATVETRAPRATIVQPANAHRTDSPVALVATTPDTDVASVRFQYKPQLELTWSDLGTPATTAPYTVAWDPRPLPRGTYHFRAVATDVRGNTDTTPPMMAIVHADVTKPAPPANVSSHANESTVSLSWTASVSDDVLEYGVYRRGAGGVSQSIGTAPSTATTFANLNVVDGAYTYAVEAVDLSGNRSDQATVAALVYTPALNGPAMCLASPTAGLSGSGAVPGATVTLFVVGSGAPSPVGTATAGPDGSFQFIDVGLTPGVNRFDVQVVDAAGNRSKRSAAVEVTYGAAPGVPSGLSSIVNGHDVSLTWLAAANAAEYRVRRDLEEIGVTIDLSITDTGVPDGRRRYSVTAINACGVESQPATLDVPVGDVTAPSAPAGLTAAVNASDVTLQWTANAEPDLAGYYIYRRASSGDWVRLTSGSVTGATFADANVLNGSYRYRVTAVDVHGNESSPSNEAPAVVDVAAPHPPASLTITAPSVGSALDLSWSAPATGPPVHRYVIYRALSSGGPYSALTDPEEPADTLLVGSTAWRDATVSNGVTYFYVVRAADAALNESGPSNEASGTPDDTLAPPKPEILSPTDAAHPKVVAVDSVAVSGVAEPGANVTLLRDGIAIGSSAARSERAVEEFTVDGDADTDAAFHPSGLVAMFVEPENSFRSVLAVTDVGTQQTRFFDAARDGDDPAFTPDGSQVLFSRYFSGFQIAALDLATGTIVQQLALPDRPEEFVVSPTGDRVAMVLYDPDTGAYQLWMAARASGVIERLTEHPDGVYDLRWSPDGNSIAYASDSNLMRITLAESTTEVVDTDYDGDAAFSPDGTTLAYNVYREDRTSVLLQNLATGAVSALPTEPGRAVEEQKLPIFSTDGAFILTVERPAGSDDDEVWLRRLGTTQSERVFVDPPDDPFWLADRSIVFVDDTAITRLILAGSFAFPDVAIDPGVNRFSAIAVDASGNTSAPADPIVLTRDTSGLSDLAIAAADVLVQPLLPVPGGRVRISATIRNTGSVTADGVTVTFLDVDQQGVATVIGSLQSLGSIAAGAQASAAVDWTASAGRHRLQVVVDPLGVVTEVSESNNRAERAVEVGVPGTPAVYIEVARPSYLATETVRIAVTAVNPTADANLVLDVTIEDALGNVAASVLHEALTPFAYGRREVAATWPAIGALAGDYRARATLRRINGEVVTNTAPFAVLPDEHVVIGVSTDRAAYADGDRVRVAGLVRNDSANVDLADASSLIEILGPGGTAVHQSESALGTLLIGAQVAPAAEWHATAPGSYAARLTARQGTRVLGTATRFFSVAGTVRVGATLAVARAAVPMGESFAVTATLGNTGSLAAAGLVARLRVVDPATQAVIRSYERSIDLAAGGNVVWPLDVSSAGLSLKPYTLALAVERPGPPIESLATATAGLSVLDVVAPIVQILSPAPNQYRNSAVAIVARVTDALSPVTQVEVRVDSGVWLPMAPADPAAGTFSFVLGANASTEGFHTVAVRATDGAGNGEAVSSTDANPVALPLTIDVTAPQIVVTGVTDGQTYPVAVTPTIAVTDPALATTTIRLNGAPFVSGTSVEAAGAYTLSVSATDQAGNAASTVANFTLVFGGPPVAASQSLTTAEDVPLAIGLGATDPDGQPLTFAVTSPAHGTLTGTAPNLTYTPALNFHGADQFTFTASDADSTSNVATVSIQVTPVNDRPVANAGAGQLVNEGATVTLDGSASADVDGDALTYHWSQISGTPVALDSSNPARPVFTAPEVPRTGGMLTFSLVVDDGSMQSVPAQVTVSVASVNKPPHAEDQSISTNEDAPVSWTLAIVEPDEDPVTFDLVGPAHGALTGAPPNLTYTPAADFHGVDHISVTVHDLAGLSATATIAITVLSVNDPPVANAGPDATVLEGDLVTLSGAASTDADGDPLTFTWTQIAGPPVTLQGAGTSAPAFTAPDVPSGGSTLTFRLVVADAETLSPPAQVNVTIKNVNHAPVAEAGTPQRVGGGVPVSLDGSLSYDPDGDQIGYAWRQIAGVLVELIGPDTARPSFVAPVVYPASVLTFELTVSDGTEEARDRVDVTVDPSNHPPIADAGPDQNVQEQESVTLDGRGSRDPDGDALIYRWAQVSGTPVALSDATVSQPRFIAPTVGASGEQLAFDLVVSDGIAESARDRVIVQVLDADHPPICTDAEASPSRLWPPNHQMVPISITGLLHRDASDLVVRIAKVTQDEPTEGTGDGDTGPDAVIEADTVSVRAERSGNGNGRVYRITFTATGGQGDSCSGTVTVEVPHQANAAAIDSGQHYDSTAGGTAKKK